MSEEKLYFATEDDNICYTLDWHIDNADPEDEEIELFEAIPDTFNNDMHWCSLYADVVLKPDCTKAQCPDYSSKSGRGVCAHRGKLYEHGEKVKFKVADYR